MPYTPWSPPAAFDPPRSWGSMDRCADPRFLHAVLLRKFIAIINEGNAHLWQAYEAGRLKWDWQRTEKVAVIGPVEFRLFETARSTERQRKNVKTGVSKTMASKHCLVPSRAGDIVPYVYDERQGRWIPIWAFSQLPKIMLPDGRVMHVWQLLDHLMDAHGVVRLRRRGVTWDWPHGQLAEDVR